MDSALPSTCPDENLLFRCFVREGSEAAFRALADRCLPLVWSVARRVANGNDAMAEDVAQVVLADFARMAHTLAPGTVPAAWLHRHTVFTATKAVRSEVRRLKREQVSVSHDSPAMDSISDQPEAWAELAPHIDSALDRLATADRSAVLLRYYEQRPLREVGRAIGITEEAARKRIDRALTKLRSYLKRRGVVPAAAILAAMLCEKSIAAPAPGVAQRILSGAWSRVEAAAFTGMASTLPPWWRRRSVVAGAAALALVSFVLWLVMAGASSAGTNRAGTRTHIQPEKKESPPPQADMPLVTVTATYMTLPEKSVTVRMLRYTPGRDDAVLYRELFPKAEALQKQIKPDESSAPFGHPLVVLSGPAKTKIMSLKPPPVPPVRADPFAAPAVPRPVASIRVRKIQGVPYPTEWQMVTETGEMMEEDDVMTIRDAGSELEANVSPPDEEGRCIVECAVNHMFAPPEFDYWRYRTLPGGEDPDHDSVRQPVFHNFQAGLPPTLVRTGEPVLVAMKTLTPEVLPGSNAQPVRLFVFLTLQP